MQWCASITELAPIDGIRAFDVDTGGVPWCLVSDSQELIDGSIHQTQVYYGQGDPWQPVSRVVIGVRPKRY